MKELNKKVFLTIFSILSAFLISGVVFYNVRSYKIEYDNVRRNLFFIEERKDYKFEPKDMDGIVVNPKDRKIDNMMIMDYEVYTVKLSDGKIDKIINHSDNSDDFDVEKVAESIISTDNGLYIGNLYNNKYSYNYAGDTIVILNTKSINDKLSLILIESLVLLVVAETLIYFVSRFITKQITKPAREAFAKQKDFIADASHELKTPLAVIMASSDELASDKKNVKYVENIKFEADRMNTLIKGLLDLSKLENGVSIDAYKVENISKIIEKICLTFEGVAFERNVLIDTNIEDDILFNCSKEEIEKLISIILDNAIKHSYDNSTILVNVNREKNILNIDITNSGDSIKDGDEEKIFERFYRADKSRNREANRYGLGLAIAKNIVVNHNGTIKAFSKNGKTTFKIVFKSK